MDKLIESSIEKCGQNGKYQYLLLIIIYFIYMITEFILIVMGYLEIWPTVSYTDKNGFPHKDVLTDDLCKNGTNYTILYDVSKQTIVTDFKLECKSYQISLIGIVYFFGVLIGSLTSHIFMDNLGRKTTIILLILVLSVFEFTFYFIYNLFVLYIVLFISGYLYIIIVLSGIVLLNECILSNIRSMFTSFIYTGFCTGGIIYSILFMYMNTWREIFMIVSALHVIIVFVFYFYALESPRFYLSKGKTLDFNNFFNQLAIKNGSSQSDNDNNSFDKPYNPESKIFNKITDEELLKDNDIKEDDEIGKHIN